VRRQAQQLGAQQQQGLGELRQQGRQLGVGLPPRQAVLGPLGQQQGPLGLPSPLQVLHLLVLLARPVLLLLGMLTALVLRGRALLRQLGARLLLLVLPLVLGLPPLPLAPPVGNK
jgi:hypothetical protein